MWRHQVSTVYMSRGPLWGTLQTRLLLIEGSGDKVQLWATHCGEQKNTDK